MRQKSIEWIRIRSIGLTAPSPMDLTMAWRAINWRCQFTDPVTHSINFATTCTNVHAMQVFRQECLSRLVTAKEFVGVSWITNNYTGVQQMSINFQTSPTLLIKLICRGTASKMHISENNYWTFGRLATLVVKMQSEISAFRQNQGTHQWIVIVGILRVWNWKKISDY